MHSSNMKYFKSVVYYPHRALAFLCIFFKPWQNKQNFEAATIALQWQHHLYSILYSWVFSNLWLCNTFFLPTAPNEKWCFVVIVCYRIFVHLHCHLFSDLFSSSFNWCCFCTFVGPRCEGGWAAEHPQLFVNNARGTSLLTEQRRYVAVPLCSIELQGRISSSQLPF